MIMHTEMPQSSRPGLLAQLAVLVPTIALSAWLTHQGVPLGTRLGLCIGFGLMLIAVVAAWQRRRG